MRDKIFEATLPVFVNYRGMAKIFSPVPSRVTIWRLEKKGIFPQGITLSSSTKVWRAQEIVDWVESHAGHETARRAHSATVFTRPLSSSKTQDSSVVMSA